MLSESTAQVLEAGSLDEVKEVFDYAIGKIAQREPEFINEVIISLRSEYGVKLESDDNGELIICRRKRPS